MTKVIENVAQSFVWSAVSRIGVPLILAVVLTGIPAHLLWAAWVNEQIQVAKHEAKNVADAVKDLKDVTRTSAERDIRLREDVSGMKSDVKSILRSLDRLEKLADARRP